MINVWDFDFNQVPGAANPDYEDQALIQRAFDHNVELIVSLERIGFEGVFYSEHHFIKSMSPCPDLLVAMRASDSDSAEGRRTRSTCRVPLRRARRAARFPT